MAKRQIRWNTSDFDSLIKASLQVNIVMKNGAVFLCQPLNLKSDKVKVKNTKGHTLDLPLAQIEEIWSEEKAVIS